MDPFFKRLLTLAILGLAAIGGYVVARVTLPTVQQQLDKLRCPELTQSAPRTEARLTSLQYVGGPGYDADPHDVAKYRKAAEFYRNILGYDDFGSWVKGHRPPPGYSLVW